MQDAEELSLMSKTAAQEAEEAHDAACAAQDGPERSRLVGMSLALEGGSARHLAEAIIAEADAACQNALVTGFAEGVTRKQLLDG